MNTDNLGNENIDMAVGYSNGYKQGYEQGKKDAVKHGHWITVSPNYSEPDDWYCECSLCGCAETDTTQFLPNYCPKCGAKMR